MTQLRNTSVFRYAFFRTKFYLYQISHQFCLQFVSDFVLIFLFSLTLNSTLKLVHYDKMHRKKSHQSKVISLLRKFKNYITLEGEV